MNELPDDIINIPIPLVGLTGANSLHFYIEKYISGRNVLEFSRLSQITTNSNSNSIGGSKLNLNSGYSVSPSTSSPNIKSLLVDTVTTPYSSSPSIDPISSSPSLTSALSSADTLSQLEDVFKPSSSSNNNNTGNSTPIVPTITTTNTSSPVLQGWKVQPLHIPTFKVSTIEIGGISIKKEKKPNHSDSYIPLGILKANWMHKHTISNPSVLSFFIQWPDDKSPKSIDPVLAQIDAIKNNIKNRNIKLIIVIILNSTNIETNDDKFMIIKKRADVDSKFFLFLNKSEVKVFVKKWEDAVIESSDLFYKDECNYTKNQISKSTHPFLVIRYNFKAAFYSELRSDHTQALRHYIFAYNSLKNLKTSSTDARGERFAEIRTVASIINFKICKLYLWGNNINEAFQQFERHIRQFKAFYGPREKEFTHAAWISKEYQVFGDLLDSAPNNPKLVITHNPSYFYQIASKYMSIRRDLFSQLPDSYKNNTSILSKFKDQKQRFDLSIYQFIGQPPPDVDHPLELVPNQHMQPQDSDIDMDFYKTISFELNINYTQIIIDLLSKSYEQTLISSNYRILSYIESLIADEYFNSQQYDLAFKYYNKNAVTYRREKWWTLLTHSISMLLKCVHYLNLPTSYVGYVMDYLSPKLNNTFTERSTIQESLINLLSDSKKLNPPLSLTSSLDVKMDHTHPLLSCRVQFPNSFTYSTNSTEFYVVVESHFPLPIRFSKLHVLFSEKSYNRTIVDKLPITNRTNTANNASGDINEERNDLLFSPDESRLFTFSLKTKEKMELECTSVILELQSSNPSVSLNFNWNISEWAIKSDQINDKDIINNNYNINNNNNLDSSLSSISITNIVKPNPYKKFLERSTIRILDHESLIQIKLNHKPPALINEFYEIEMEILNNDTEITKGTIKFEINGTLQNEKSIYMESSKSSEPLSVLELPHIQEKSTFKKKFYIYSATADDDSKLLVNVSYENKTNEISHSSKLFSIPVVVGLIPQFQFFNSHFQQADMYDGNIIVNEPLFLNVDIKSNLPWSIFIKSINLNTSTNNNNGLFIQNDHFDQNNLNLVATVDQPQNQQQNLNNVVVVKLLSNSNENLKSIELVKDNINYTSWFNLLPLVIGESISFGTLSIEYSRDSENGIINRIPIQLPLVRVASNPFITQVNVPSFGIVGVPLQHSISIKNNTNFLQEFELIVINPPSYGSTDVPFFFSGEKISSFTIHSNCNYIINHTLLPLVAGKHSLPHFKITSKRFNKELPQTKNTNNYLFIKPNLDLTL